MKFVLRGVWYVYEDLRLGFFSWWGNLDLNLLINVGGLVVCGRNWLYGWWNIMKKICYCYGGIWIVGLRFLVMDDCVGEGVLFLWLCIIEILVFEGFNYGYVDR